MSHRRRLALALAVLTVGCQNEVVATWNRIHGDGYSLDVVSREVPRGSAAACPDGVETIDYRGDAIPYLKPVQVAPDFADKLRVFEHLVAELALEYYGRQPDRLLHFGAKACRSVRGRPQLLSEHALGNALDVSGFRFDKLRKPPKDKKINPAAFTVTVAEHWVEGKGPNAAVHAEFLHLVVGRVLAKRMFRGVIGPGHEGHADHFHFDQAPWSYALF